MTINELKTYMKNKDITQAELSEISKIPLQTLRKIFSGVHPNPRLDTVNAVCEALGIDISLNAILKNSKSNLTDNEERLLRAFDSLIPPMQDYILEMTENLVGKQASQTDTASVGKKHA